jgi:hypothetical protein
MTFLFWVLKPCRFVGRERYISSLTPISLPTVSSNFYIAVCTNVCEFLCVKIYRPSKNQGILKVKHLRNFNISLKVKTRHVLVNV